MFTKLICHKKYHFNLLDETNAGKKKKCKCLHISTFMYDNNVWPEGLNYDKKLF